MMEEKIKQIAGCGSNRIHLWTWRNRRHFLPALLGCAPASKFLPGLEFLRNQPSNERSAYHPLPGLLLFLNRAVGGSPGILRNRLWGIWLSLFILLVTVFWAVFFLPLGGIELLPTCSSLARCIGRLGSDFLIYL